MNLPHLFWWIYQLSPLDLFLIPLAGTLIFFLLLRRAPYRRQLLTKRQPPVPVVLIFLFSLIIELLQLTLGLGQGEIDDMLHNTLGAWLGCMVLSLESRLPRVFPVPSALKNQPQRK